MIKPQLNTEQSSAALNEGGILVEAGAGSGKTRVIIEHFIYKCHMWKEEFLKYNLKNQQETYLETKLESIVIVTFTNKAANEILIRLKKRIHQETSFHENPVDKTFWHFIHDHLDFVTVSTIHSFANKLIKQGLVSFIGRDLTIIDKKEFFKKIDSLVEQWALYQTNEQTAKNELKFLYRHHQEFKKIIYKILDTPYLRYSWLQKNKKDSLNIEDQDPLKKILQFLLYDEFINFPQIDLTLFSKNNKTKWYEFLVELESIRRDCKFNLTSLELLHQFFSGLSRFPSFPKILNEKIEDSKKFWELMKGIRNFLKNHWDSISFFNQENKPSSIWIKITKSLLNYIEHNYLNLSTLTFNDLEYYTYCGLIDNNSTIDKISAIYQYFIVDEFQDTSILQFNIISLIIQNNYNQLFCVGDIKQAIYGFRGGTTKVFLSCKDKLPHSRELQYNYRSSESIINFNNSFFKYLFKSYYDHINYDRHYKHMDFQKQLVGKEDSCDYKYQGPYCLKLPQWERESIKLSNLQFNYIEALVLAEKIEKLSTQIENDETIVILYKNLAPSIFLIEQLINKNLSFTAQIKIPLNRDPIFCLFSVLIDSCLLKNDDLNYVMFMIDILFEHHQLIPNQNLDLHIQQFKDDIHSLGTLNAFHNFLFVNQVINPIWEYNLKQIEIVCKLGYDRPDKIWAILSKLNEEKFAIDAKYGSNPKKIQVMTVHSAKGLEFNHVFLGGISTNSIGQNERTILGDGPQSYSVRHPDKKKFLKSPHLILEEFESEAEESDENKRLFYVACTRAMTSITWFSPKANFLVHSPPKNSWVIDLAHFQQQDKDELIQDEVSSLAEKQLNILSHLNDNRPLSFEDLRPLQTKGLPRPYLGMISELSVTRLTSLIECPKKFYLQNICKIQEDEMLLVQEALGQIVSKPITISSPKDESTSIYSDKERGTQVHRWIFEIITHKMTPKNSPHFPGWNLKAIHWFRSLLEKEKENYELHAERTFKFPFFGTIISGGPDLILKPIKANDKPLSIWEYKTGAIQSWKLNGYWFQIKCYAHAIYQLNWTLKSQPIHLKIVFLDENRVLEQLIEYETLENELFKCWKNTQYLHQTNIDHCIHCNYQHLCARPSL